MDISIVIPVFNEELNIKPLYRQLDSVLGKKEIVNSYEIIFVDDGSTDNTSSFLEQIAKKDKNAKVIKLRRNSGKTAALSAGFDLAKGKIIMTMDSDLQNNPSDIPLLIQKIREGYDVVSGWRSERKDPFFSKKVPSKISNWMASKLTGIKIHDFNCPIKAYKRESLEGIKLFGEMHRYIPALAALNGFSVTEIKVRHYPRKYGKSKYGFGRLIKGFLDLVYLVFWSNYSTRPFHFFGILGLLEMFIGFVIVLYKLIVELLIFKMPLVIGPLSILALITIITGIQLFVFGLLMEIQIRTYYKGGEEVYHIEKILNK